MFYVLLTIATVGIALFVQNQAYVPGYLSGRRSIGYERQQARNLAAEIGVYGLLAGVSACRVAIGADYWVYWANFQLIAQGRHVSYEFGFRWVVRLMQAIFGDDTYRTIFFLFSVVTVFFFLKALHDQARCYAATLFLLLAGGYYFSSMQSVRYYFALAIAMYSAKYVIRGEYGKFVLWILMAATFHKSVLVTIPAYLLAWWLAKMKWKRKYYLWGAGLATVVIFTQVWWQQLARQIIFFFYPYYENSAFDTGEISWANVGKCLGVLLLSLICWRRSLSGEGEQEGQERQKRQERKEGQEKQQEGKWVSLREEQLPDRFYFFLNLEGLLLYTCGSFIPEISRIGYYLIVFQIFLIPHLLVGMKKGWLKNLCTAGSMGAFTLYFAMYLIRAFDDSINLLPYSEWIFH